MSTVHLPGPMEVRELLADLLGREVTLSTTSPFAPGPYNRATYGVYVDDALRVRALIALDMPLSAYGAAAIGLVPPAGALDAMEAGRLPDTLRENLSEVFNIAASTFNVAGAEHLRLHAVHHVGDQAPHDVEARALTLGRREDLRIDVAGYGGGRLSVILT
ncbi:hypothetical protein [Nocardioides perillae]|uniref:Chemotaxis protein CheX n=1 Tax=Nocardioides perillae TaxID=1119534 RepID=A0A7Y9UT14_9ACTN|nr:hypothetical protein [Nocardioides perillae]NYG57029.1 hypothetical protein [Nocardioides perillae]